MRYTEILKESYAKTMHEKSKGECATKDIVGRNYENMRIEWIRNHGLDVATDEEKKVFKSRLDDSYDADHFIVDKDTRKLLALEEDKGHYLDKCFAKRAIFNAAEVFALCMEKNLELPYFIISCPTNYNFHKILETTRRILDPKVSHALVEKLKFFPTCNHGRVSRKHYLTSGEFPFKVEEENVNRESRFLLALREVKNDV
jgi:hypothetical protein